MAKKIGKHTVLLESAPAIMGYAAVGSKMESEGPMAHYFDIINQDSFFGQDTWEKAESRIQHELTEKVLSKSGLSTVDIDFVFAGDLLNQCTATSYGLRAFPVAVMGLYSACATFAQAVSIGALFVESGGAKNVLAMTSSHFCSAERQFRLPLEYGGQRTPSSQWTVTGGGAVAIGESGQGIYIRSFTAGEIEDKCIKDVNNMGAAMAPAAASTLCNFFKDTNTAPEDYDLILTGDLAEVGSDLLKQLMQREGYNIENKHSDCGLLIYDRDSQKVEAGGSGAGCSSSVFCSYILQSMSKGKLADVLLVATGALMSTVSFQQGESIPGIAHLVHISTSKE